MYNDVQCSIDQLFSTVLVELFQEFLMILNALLIYYVLSVLYTKGVVIKIKVKDKKNMKRKGFHGQYGANVAKSKKEILVGTKEKGVYRKGGGTVVEKDLI